MLTPGSPCHPWRTCYPWLTLEPLAHLYRAVPSHKHQRVVYPPEGPRHHGVDAIPYFLEEQVLILVNVVALQVAGGSDLGGGAAGGGTAGVQGRGCC